MTLLLLVLLGCAVPPEVCDDGWDNDGDAIVDCADDDCDGEAGCRERNCDDNVDNEGDGAADCLDADCDGEALCHEAECDDAYDNDHDGELDCADSDCVGLAACLEVCDDGRDNDADGLFDCEDGDCAGLCVETACADQQDDDHDGLIDCADSECWGELGCPALTVVADEGVAHYQHSYHTFPVYSGGVLLYTARQSAAVWTVSDVRGRLMAPGGFTCDFGVDRVQMGWGFDVDYSRVHPTVREGFRLSPLCPFRVRVEQLPGDLSPDMTQAPRSGDAIYRFGTWTRNGVDSTAPILPP